MYSLYVLELEPGKDDRAMWYVGITNDIERRMKHHYGHSKVAWVSRNKVQDHIVVGEWHKGKASYFEDELTGLLMHEYGYWTTRGGNHTNPTIAGAPATDPTDPSDDLIRALARTDHDGLLRVVGNYPIFSWRRSPTDGREDSKELHLYDDTSEAEPVVHRRLERRIGTEIHENDLREAIYRAGMRNLDDVEEELRRWGASG